MTDKQIIIDGVDVSGCECYSEHREGYCGWHIPCEGDICPYKLKWALQQLKRAEQKLEKIKEICKNVMPTGIDEETDKFGDILEIIEE